MKANNTNQKSTGQRTTSKHIHVLEPGAIKGTFKDFEAIIETSPFDPFEPSKRKPDPQILPR